MDFLLKSPNTAGYIEAIQIDGYTGLSDHRSFSFTIAKNKIENGPRYWRFNNQLLENPELLFGMTHRIRRTIRDNTKEKLSHNMTDQQISQSPSTLSPQLLMDMILCDARAYSIKFTATRKKFDNTSKLEKDLELEDAVRLLELDTGQDQKTTNKLMVRVNTLKDTIQAPNDYDEQEAARKYMAKRNLEAETPPKTFVTK